MARSMWINSSGLFILIVFLLICKSWGEKCSKNSFGHGTHIQLDYGVENDSLKINTTVNGCISPLTLSVLKEAYVREVSCNDHNVQYLWEQAIANLSKIETVVLRRNRIKTIKKGAFTNLPKLYNVDLTDNQIEVSDDDIFINAPNLLTLHMSRNNLQEFTTEWLGNVQDLQILDLSQNSIPVLSRYAFKELHELILLNISYNQIGYIDEKAFYGVSNLYTLDLSYNKIKRLHDNLFGSFSRLLRLNLYSNSLSYISDEVLESLNDIEELIALYNPWLCGCYEKILQWTDSDGKYVMFNEVDKPYSLSCDGGINIKDSAVCVVTDEVECMPNYPDDLLDVLVSEQGDYHCYIHN